MTPLTHTFAIVTAYWCIIYAFNRLLLVCPTINLWYAQCQEVFGFHTTFAYMRCYTKRFNGLFKVWGTCCHRRLARAWFNMGVVVSLCLMVTSLCVLSFSLYQSLFGRSDREQVLTPIMPGVNLPWNQIVYYFMTLLICGVFHEMGHALAAVTEQVRINGFGLFVLFLYPGAFVDLHSDHLTLISPLRQLRIYCAGVWHNIILVGVAGLSLLSFPYLLVPFYTTGHGAVVTSVTRESVLWGKLSPGVAVIQINSCPVLSKHDWTICLEDILAHTQKGFCVSNNYLLKHKLQFLNSTRELPEGGKECCNLDNQSDICFAVKLLDGEKRSQSDSENKFVCLTARHVVNDDKTCVTNDDCTAVQSNSICTTPTISQYSHLVKIKHTGPGDTILFLGDLRLLQYSITATNYHSSYPSLPIWLPQIFETLFTYIASISSALALLNIIPAYALDGHWALNVLLECLMPQNVRRTKIANVILTFGSSLLVLNILAAFWKLMNW